MKNSRGVPPVLLAVMHEWRPHHPSGGGEAAVGLNVLKFTQQYDFIRIKCNKAWQTPVEKNKIIF